MIFPWWLTALGGAICASILALMAHNLDVNRIEAKNKETLAAQIKFDIIQCSDSKQPAKEANNDSETKTKQLLNSCIERLRKPAAKCLPISRAASSTPATNRPEASGVTDTAIEASNLESQKDRNDLNSAKIWGQGYEKYTQNQRHPVTR